MEDISVIYDTPIFKFLIIQTNMTGHQPTGFSNYCIMYIVVFLITNTKISSCVPTHRWTWINKKSLKKPIEVIRIRKSKKDRRSTKHYT